MQLWIYVDNDGFGINLERSLLFFTRAQIINILSFLSLQYYYQPFLARGWFGDCVSFFAAGRIF